MTEQNASEPDAHKRLGSMAEARRRQLGFRQDNLPAGPSSTTVTLIENGGVVGGLAYKRLEDSLGWRRGSVENVLNGGEPTLTEATMSPGTPLLPRPTGLIHRSEDDLLAIAEWDPVKAYLIMWEAAVWVLRNNAIGPLKQLDADTAVSIGIKSADEMADRLLAEQMGSKLRPVLQRLFADRHELEERGFSNHAYWYPKEPAPPPRQDKDQVRNVLADSAEGQRLGRQLDVAAEVVGDGDGDDAGQAG